MDSKLKRITVISVIFATAVILGTVVFANLYQSKGQEDQALARQERGRESSEETEETVDLDAFLRDETFFDRDPSKYDIMRSGEEKRLSLSAVSVEKDLRIQVVNGLGQLVSGQELFITLNGAEEYKDLDKDGVIYIGDLSPGDYEVSLKETEGFKVPAGSVKVYVKEKVEYTPIEDISLLIRSEQEVDAQAEDTQKADAEDEADGSENKEIQSLEGNLKFGIDVSKWNKEIDWEKLRETGVDYAIIRCGYRGSMTGALVEDPYFLKNIEGAKKAGIPVGLYFFTQAVSAVEAVEEASMVLCLAGEYDLEYPVFIDTESAGGNGRADSLDVETRTEVCRAFCETIENAGYEAGVYASRNWYNTRVRASELDSHVIWLAEYRDTPQYQGKYQMWQYTSSGSLPGIEGRVDFNISYLGY